MAQLNLEDAVSLLDYFQNLEDPRSEINRKHLLGDLIVICILAVISGAEGPKAIGLWAEAHAEWLQKILALPYGIPSHDTIGRLLVLLKPAAFQTCFEQWITRLRESSIESSHVKQNNRRPKKQRWKIAASFA